MNENGIISVDASRVNRLLEELNLDKKETKNAFRQAFRKSATVIRRQAQENMKTVKNKTGKTLDYRNLLQFVNMTVYRDGTGARVDIMDNKKKSTNVRLAKKGLDNKSFTVKFFSLGTDPRFTKGYRKVRNPYATGRNNKYQRVGRGGYRGQIGKSDFFKRAVESKKGEAESVLEKNIVECINKIVSKRK